MAISEARAALWPSPTLPLAYFAGAQVALAVAAAILLVSPDLPGAFHYHPRLIAVIHLVTLGWITASILGAFYIVAPLAFGMPFAARGIDTLACGLFWIATTAVVGGFWASEYGVVGVASIGVLAVTLVVGTRAVRGLARAKMPAGVSLHVGLAFGNMVLAGSAGLVLAVARASGVEAWSPLAAAAAHAHLAVLGWGAMMIMGVAYRLVPMVLPAAMPTGGGLAWSAVLLEVGTLGIAWGLLAGTALTPWAVVTMAAFAVFFVRVRGILADRRPRPAEMQGRDWSTWQTHTALLYVVVAVVVGLWLPAVEAAGSLGWLYGVAGIMGFVAQMVVGIQGRLLPIHAWYRDGPARRCAAATIGASTCRSTARARDLPAVVGGAAAVDDGPDVAAAPSDRGRGLTAAGIHPAPGVAHDHDGAASVCGGVTGSVLV